MAPRRPVSLHLVAVGKNDRVGFGSRGTRRGGNILVGVLVLVVILVLLVSLIQSLTTTPREEAVSQQAYLDAVLPLVERSTQAGKDLAAIREDPVKLGRDGTNRAVDRISQENEFILRDLQAVPVPKQTAIAHSLLIGTLAHRRAGTIRFRGSIDRATSPDVPAQAAAEGLTEVGRDLTAGDRSYLLFRESLVNPERPMPDSKWIVNENDWRSGVLAYWVESMRNKAGTRPVHDVAIIANAVTTTPPDLRVEGEPPNPVLAVIPPSAHLAVQAIVVNKGNSPESRVQAEATVVATTNNQVIDRVSDAISLNAGQNRTLIFKLKPPPVNTPFKLMIKVGPVPGDPTPQDGEFSRDYVVR